MESDSFKGRYILYQEFTYGFTYQTSIQLKMVALWKKNYKVRMDEDQGSSEISLEIFLEDTGTSFHANLSPFEFYFQELYYVNIKSLS